MFNKFNLPSNSRQLDSYRKLGLKVHLVGILAGVLCGIGNAFNFIVGQSIQGFAVSYAIAQVTGLVNITLPHAGKYARGVIVGVFVWKELHNTPVKTKLFYAIGFFLYVIAVVLITLSITFWSVWLDYVNQIEPPSKIICIQMYRKTIGIIKPLHTPLSFDSIFHSFRCANCSTTFLSLNWVWISSRASQFVALSEDH